MTYYYYIVPYYCIQVSKACLSFRASWPKNTICKEIEKSKVNIVQAPDGMEGPGFFVTTMDKAVGLGRKNSLWPLPFATSCCGIEFMATAASTYDLGRFGAERLSFSPRQADLLMVMGTISKKM